VTIVLPLFSCREVFQKEKSLQFHELNKREIEITSQKNQLELLSHELKRKEKQLLEKEREIERDLIKTQLTKEGMQPIHDLYHSEKERLRELQDDLRHHEEELSSRENQILRKEKYLSQKENEIKKILYFEIEEKKEKLREQDRQRAEYGRAIQRNCEILEKEKEKIYKCSLELKRQYDIIQSGYRKWKKALRSMNLRGGGGGGLVNEKNIFESTRRGRREDDWMAADDMQQIFEIEQEVNWGDLIGGIRDEIHLLDMGSGSESGSDQENHLRLIGNQEIGDRKRGVVLRKGDRIHLKTADGDRENEDVLSILDAPMMTRSREGVPEDSLEYSLISTSPVVLSHQSSHHDIPLLDRMRDEQRELTHHHYHPPSQRSQPAITSSSSLLPVPFSRGGEINRGEVHHKLTMLGDYDKFKIGSGSDLSATIDLQITTEQMKTIAMKYKDL
jgi:hypothetical protein